MARELQWINGVHSSTVDNKEVEMNATEGEKIRDPVHVRTKGCGATSSTVTAGTTRHTRMQRCRVCKEVRYNKTSCTSQRRCDAALEHNQVRFFICCCCCCYLMLQFIC